MMFDEQFRSPAPIQGAMFLELPRDYRDGLLEIDVLTLVCAGADEKWVSVAAVEYAADLLPYAQLGRFEDSGHCITVKEPERFNQVVSDFIESL